MPNRLIDETSPYLLQHANNPVDWYPWGQEALERASAEDKPILLSVGYSACHWCHVMERESFEDPSIAAMMNQSFVCIKVDREERPDIDSIFMTAVQALSGQGGWPMTVFLTPDCKPFYGGTYFPPDDRHGMPGFPSVLAAMSAAYRERRGGRDSRHHSAREPDETAHPERAEPGPAHRRGAAPGPTSALVAKWNDRFGGVGSQPKFPQPMTFEFPVATPRPHGRPTVPRTRGADPGQHGPRRHLRPRRRRFPSLLHRLILAGAALREDALRQRAAREAVPAHLPGDRKPRSTGASSRRRWTTCCVK